MSVVRIYSYIIRAYLIAIILQEVESLKSELKTKRQINSIPLVYPYGGTYKLLVGFAEPVPNDEHINLLFVANFQYQYLQFQNISELSQYYFIDTVSREQREADLNNRNDERLIFYKALEQMLDAKGFSGRACLLRAICEAAQHPFEEQGLVGEILHILLTPDYGRSPFQEADAEWRDTMWEYVSARAAGRQMFSCACIYEDCPEGQGRLRPRRPARTSSSRRRQPKRIPRASKSPGFALIAPEGPRLYWGGRDCARAAASCSASGGRARGGLWRCLILNDHKKVIE
ncbi:hypothetical protein EVAR_91387_1 [Eumeta japonica]|uniref:Uncharacterized protein n=1 Tax=Eumeta variegata TaxID=151549 RepID=A0A4C1XBJ3_EUMVA|nr:hypothetical protein EVAR_91387_1 [Eumeta japonica]